MGRTFLSVIALLTLAVAATLDRTAVHAGPAPHDRVLGALPGAPSVFSAAPVSSRQGRSARQVQRVAHGLRLSLAIAGRSYPANALIRATLTVANISRRPISLLAGGPQQPGKTFPQVEVLDFAGTILSPSLLEGYVPPPGPGPSVRALAPGRSITSIAYLVLSGPRVRAAVELVPPHGRLDATTRIVTPALTIHVLPADPPHIILSSTSTGLRADVERPPAVRGPLLFLDAASCPGSGFNQHLVWTRSSPHLNPGCPAPQAWHIVAGWPDYSVATLDYTAPVPQPTLEMPPMGVPPTPPAGTTSPPPPSTGVLTATPIPTPTARGVAAAGPGPTLTPTPGHLVRADRQ